MAKVSVIVPVYNVENYIRDMLNSVRQQTFTDFEVIMIDDGSTDGSLEIMEEFSLADSRFKCFAQSNAGVSATRNRGLDIAKGEYAVFYDPDDFIPAEAMGKLYRAAVKANADMAIGVMVEKSLGESLIYMSSQKLAKMKNIEPTDKHFIGAWSLCNKMFSLDFIRKNNLRFEKLHNAEDGVFTFCALNCKPKITGCDTVAYNYVRRPFWIDASATQIVSEKFVRGLLDSHDRIIEEAQRLSATLADEAKRREYMQELYARFINVEMINAYYRRIWKATGDVIPVLRERIDRYRSFITDVQWQKIVKQHQDLHLEEGLFTADELAMMPEVSIAVSAGLTDKQLAIVLGGIYSQLFQRFEVLVPSSCQDRVDKAYRGKQNLHFIDDENFRRSALEYSASSYVIYIDDFAVFTKNSLKNMHSALSRAHNLDFVSMLLKNCDGREFAQIRCLRAAFGYTKSGRRKFGSIAACDCLISNKLFRKDALRRCGVYGESTDEVVTLYKTLKFERLSKGMMITDMDDAAILNRTAKKPLAFAIRLNAYVNNAVDRAVWRLKRLVTREDIDKLKKRLGR